MQIISLGAHHLVWGQARNKLCTLWSAVKMMLGGAMQCYGVWSARRKGRKPWNKRDLEGPAGVGLMDTERRTKDVPGREQHVQGWVREEREGDLGNCGQFGMD